MKTPAVAHRQGFKGVDAAGWLSAQGVPVPEQPNRVCHWADGRCLRLGSTEFLLEQDAPAEHAAAWQQGEPKGQAWRLLRSDHSLLMDATTWPALLPQACSFDFERLRAEPDLVVMTLLAGISVTLVREPAAESTAARSDTTRSHYDFALRLWCDASYARYLDHSLQQLAALSPLGEQR